MNTVLGLSGAGLSAASDLLGAVATNVANVDTPGYGARQAEVGSAASVLERPTNIPFAGQVVAPGFSYTSGASLTQDVPTFGDSVSTSSVGTNLAIDGGGFFMVSNGQGQTFYTRAGQFSQNANGTLVLPNGMKLEPPVTLAAGSSYAISATGAVTESIGNTVTPVGQIQLANFANDAGLANVGGNLYQATANSGAATVNTPGAGGTGTIQAGAFNDSNVNLQDAYATMIQAQTMYQMNAKVMTISQGLDQSIDTLNI